jgi:DNA-binding CsgD family transcriptional regulator
MNFFEWAKKNKLGLKKNQKIPNSKTHNKKPCLSWFTIIILQSKNRKIKNTQKMKTTKKKKVAPKTKNTYSLDDKASAKRYYLLGLTLNEISKLTNAPARTIEKWQIAEKWKLLREIKPIESKALDLFNNGKSYTEIAVLLKISKATVWRYLNKAKKQI